MPSTEQAVNALRHTAAENQSAIQALKHSKRQLTDRLAHDAGASSESSSGSHPQLAQQLQAAQKQAHSVKAQYDWLVQERRAKVRNVSLQARLQGSMSELRSMSAGLAASGTCHESMQTWQCRNQTLNIADACHACKLSAPPGLAADEPQLHVHTPIQHHAARQEQWPCVWQDWRVCMGHTAAVAWPLAGADAGEAPA
jgi:hypothetical protein